MRAKGYSPLAVVQLTDIDPKIYSKARNTDTKKITRKYFRRLMKDLAALEVLDNFCFSRVSDFQIQMKDQIINLIMSNSAYSYGGNVYLNSPRPLLVSPFGNGPEELDNMPIDLSDGKIDQKDIMIWNADNFYPYEFKTSDSANNFFHNFLVSGVPGWHFQDSQIIKTIFNGRYDFHGGASELVYPHHEFIYRLLGKLRPNDSTDEKAVSWIHLGILKINSRKMSNSSGNVISTRTALKSYNPNTIKIFFLNHPYSNDIEYTKEKIEKANLIDEKIASFFCDLFCENMRRMQKLDKKSQTKYSNFIKILDKNYDTRDALGFILECISDKDNPDLINKMTFTLGLRYY